MGTAEAQPEREGKLAAEGTPEETGEDQEEELEVEYSEVGAGRLPAAALPAVNGAAGRAEGRPEHQTVAACSPSGSLSEPFWTRRAPRLFSPKASRPPKCRAERAKEGHGSSRGPGSEGHDVRSTLLLSCCSSVTGSGHTPPAALVTAHLFWRPWGDDTPALVLSLVFL